MSKNGHGLSVGREIAGGEQDILAERIRFEAWSLRHVEIDAKRGLTTGYAEISGQDVKVQVQEGEPVPKQPGMQIPLR